MLRISPSDISKSFNLRQPGVVQIFSKNSPISIVLPMQLHVHIARVQSGLLSALNNLKATDTSFVTVNCTGSRDHIAEAANCKLGGAPGKYGIAAKFLTSTLTSTTPVFASQQDNTKCGTTLITKTNAGFMLVHANDRPVSSLVPASCLLLQIHAPQSIDINIRPFSIFVSRLSACYTAMSARASAARLQWVENVGSLVAGLHSHFPKRILLPLSPSVPSVQGQLHTIQYSGTPLLLGAS
jgi:hypothetical protein